MKTKFTPDQKVQIVLESIKTNIGTAERGLHESGIHCKMRGRMKSKNMPNAMGNVFACFMTWKVQWLITWQRADKIPLTVNQTT